MGNVWSKPGTTSSSQAEEANDPPSPGSTPSRIKDVADLEELLVQARKAKDTLESKWQQGASQSSEASSHPLEADNAREHRSELRYRSRRGSRSTQSSSHGEIVVPVPDRHNDHEIDIETGSSSTASAGGETSQSSSQGDLRPDPSQAPRVQFNVDDATQLDSIFDFIRVRKKKQSTRVNPVLKFLGAIVEGVGTSSERISSALARQGIRQQNEPHSHAFWRDVYHILRNFHWINLGLGLLVDGLLRLYKMKKNSDACWSILEDLEGHVRRKIPHLGKAYPDEVARIQAVIWILEAITVCEKHLRSGVIARFSLVYVTEDDTKDPQARIAEISKALSTAAVKPLGPSKCAYREDTVGLEKKIPEVLSILRVTGEETQPGVQAILLYGMGGIGKTTLGREVCAKIRTDYRYAEVEVGQEPPDICRLQGSIYRQLSRSTGTQAAISTWNDGQEQLEDLLKTCTTPVLLFIDNVFKENDLSRLLPRSLGLPDGSCIIVTSRDKIVSTSLERIDIKCHSYKVEKLQESESKTLFDDILGGCPVREEKVYSAILRKCDGWPLALSLVGGYLKRKKDDPDAWSETLDCLRNCEAISSRSEDDMIKILRWTYERLDKRAQNLFLDACLLRNERWEFLESLGPSNALDCLQDLSLVKKREERKMTTYNKSSGSIEIHDIFFDYGRQRAPPSPMTRMRIDTPEMEMTNYLQNDLEGSYRHVEGLVARYLYKPVLAKQLDEMHQTLRILIVECWEGVEGECVQVPQNLQICWIEMCRFPYSGLSGLDKLSVLYIDGNVRFDFTTVQFPGSLKTLCLSRVQSLQFSLDAFKLCTGLHTVNIRSCNALTELPASFCSLGKLCVLVLHENKELHTLPDGFGQLKSLKTLYVVNSATELPSAVSTLTSLRKLHVKGDLCLPIDFHLSLLTRLEDLVLECGMDIRPQLLHGVGNLKKLHKLNLGCCDRVEQLPEDFCELTSLETLALKNCRELTKLPAGFGELQRLSMLELWECESLSGLPEDFCELTSLETLALKNCRELTKLPAGFGELQRLSMLELWECESLSGLPDGFSKLSSLRRLTMTNCESLKRLPRGFCGLPLVKLTLSTCKSLEQLPNEFSKLTSLEELKLTWCLSLENLPEGFTDLQSLRILDMSGCENLCCLPSDFSNLKSLQWLEMDGCKSLKDLPLGFARLPNLQLLSLERCVGLERLPSDFGDLRALQYCYLNHCMNLEPLLKKDEEFVDRLNGMDLEALSEEDEQFMTRLIFICRVFALPTLFLVRVEGCNDLLQAFHTCGDYSSQLASALALVKVEGYSPLLQVLRHHVLVPRKKDYCW